MESNYREQHLIIRADAGANIGAGHLMRCLALSQSWQAQGGSVTFVTNCQSEQLRTRLENEGFAVVELDESYPNPIDLEITQTVLQKFTDCWCVLDGYHFDLEYQRAVRQAGSRVLVIDDNANMPFYEAAAILNQNINAVELNYNCLPETTLLLGTRYALLRKEFDKWQNFEREIPKTVRKLLITMGGGDVNNQTLKALNALDQLKVKNLEVKAVVGANNPHWRELERAAQKSLVTIELVRSADNMDELMAWADLAISASGSTCWELAFMQLPCILIILAENQKDVAAGLDKTGFALNLGWFDKNSEEDLTEKLNEIITDENRRARMSKIGKKLVDGWGATRVTQILRESRS